MTANFTYEVLSSKSPVSEDEFSSQTHETRRWNRVIIANLALFLSSLICLGLSLLLSRSKTIDARELLRQTTFYSPLIETMSPIFAATHFATYPMLANHSILRQPPSPEVDAYWNRISDLGMMPITEKQVRDGLGKDPSTVIKAPEAWDLGNDAYLVQLDGLHLLHCLNSMRQSLHYNFPYYHKDGQPPAYVAHLSHCQEALARWLMCHPSMDLIKFDWVEDHSRPFPDFDITRKCMDFEGLLAWQEKHRLPEEWLQEQWQAIDRPGGLVPQKSPILNEEARLGKWISLQDTYKGQGMPKCESWRAE